MINHFMPLLRPKVSLTLIVTYILASLFWLPLQSVHTSPVSPDVTKTHLPHTSRCVGEEIPYNNKANERACVTVVHHRQLEYSESERACVNSEYSANLPIFVDQEDADNFTTYLVSKSHKLSINQPFFVAYETEYKILANEFEVESVSFKCFVPTLMTHDETEDGKKHHYVSVDGNKNEQSYCSDYEKHPRNYEDDGADANEQRILDCVQVQAESAVVGLAFNNALFSRADCSQPAQVVCIRWLLEYECEAPEEIGNIDNEDAFMDGDMRFFYDGEEEVCYRYDCNKDNVKKHETTCKVADECYGKDRIENCLPGIPPVTKPPVKKPESPGSGGSPRSVLSESTIWVVICAVLAVLILLILLVIYLVNQKDEGDSAASMNPYRTIHEYWRSNRRNSRYTIGDDEPVEAAYSAYSIYDESLSDTSSLQLAGGYGDVIRRTVSTGATGSGPTYLGTSGGVPGDMSQASSTCNVTGEPPPMYNDDFHYKRKQQRMNSTNSINSAGEYAPPYTSRPVSAASSFMSLGGPGTGLPGSQFASNNDIHKPISNGSTCQIFQGTRGRNPSGKKVKFSPHPNPPCPGPKDRHRHMSDMDPSTARKRHLSDLPILSNSAGGAMMHNAMANMQPPVGPRSVNQSKGAPKDLKPALRIRHRSAEQSSTVSQLGSTGAAGNGSALPTIQPPPHHPNSRLLKTATTGSGGNLLSGSSRSILNEISGANLTNGTGQQANKAIVVSPSGVTGNQIKPNSGFDTSVRQRHVSADQTWSGRKRKDSDMIGLLDDQSPLILTPGSDGNSKNVNINPFLFSKDGKTSNQQPQLQKQQNRPIAFRNNSNSQIAPSPLNVSSSANALTVRSPHQEFASGQSLVPSQPQAGALKQQQQRFSDQDLTDTASGGSSGGVRPRSRSVTDQNRQFNPMGTDTNTEKNVEKTNDPVTFKLGFLGNGGSGSRSSISSSSERNASTSVGPPKQGAINASYEDESMC